MRVLSDILGILGQRKNGFHGIQKKITVNDLVNITLKYSKSIYQNEQ